MTIQKRFIILAFLAALAVMIVPYNWKKYNIKYSKYYDNYTFGQLKDSLFSDTLLVGLDVDSSGKQRQWYTDRVKELITDLKDDWGHSDSLYPLQKFDKIKVSKMPWEWDQTLTNEQANKLLKIITDPLSFDWSETTNDGEMVFEFYRNEQLVETFMLAGNSVINASLNWPNFKKMKFGHLKPEPQKQLLRLLKEIDYKY
jgi:hypothetical protein